ncbi:hypothetical protein GCM10027049_13300 [Mucilaginibacter puniceus]
MRKTLLILLASLAFLQTSAQKLPKVQTASVRAPANIKIDGKATEWNDKFQAYNPATEIFYTISNDDKNLYLITYVYSSEVLFYKVMTGGINFQIEGNDHELSFCYPAFNDPPPELSRHRAALSGKEDHPLIVKDNKLFADNAKVIEVIGIDGITDSVPIYNEYGISVAGRFDASLGYIYELAIPLKYLSTSNVIPQTFKYKISVKGKYMKPLPKIIGITRADGSTTTAQADLDAFTKTVQGLETKRYAETNFTGEYTLAK